MVFQSDGPVGLPVGLATFFGPVGQEVGAIWTFFDGNATALGSIAAKKGP